MNAIHKRSLLALVVFGALLLTYFIVTDRYLGNYVKYLTLNKEPSAENYNTCHQIFISSESSLSDEMHLLGDLPKGVEFKRMIKIQGAIYLVEMLLDGRSPELRYYVFDDANKSLRLVGSKIVG